MNIKNRVGERYGLLTVIKRSGANSSGHTTWECICECGNKTVCTGNNLKCGHSKSCGCLKKRPVHENLNGRKFGKLTVIENGKTVKGVKFWICKCKCGNKCEVSSGHLKSGHNKSCGCLRSEVSRKLAYKNIAGKKKISPNGTLPKRNTSEGYIKVHDRDHPFCDKGGFVAEHRVVMEKHLGRFLLKSETVHHKNGVRHDNRVVNLELWDKSHPYGQRVEDKIKWCIEFLKRHGVIDE